MITVLTSHAKIWHPETVVSDILKEYKQQGNALVSFNQEGPCADASGMYALLDYVCNSHGLDKTKITIQTANFEEQHPEYIINKTPQPWITQTVSAFNSIDFTASKKTTQNLFGCIYNVPSWDRLCLLSYIHRTNKQPSLLQCNGTWEPNRYNSYYLDSVTDYCPEEFFNIADYLKTNPTTVLQDLLDKPITASEMMKVVSLYNNFFIDIVSETYTHGLTFFITEKTLRPMLAMTPFIINGPQGYLSTLKSDYGLKTFDQYWNESYDSYQNYERIQKIYKVIDYIDNKSNLEILSMYNDMLDILKHNYNRLQELNDKK
jgi:hypothetical protein